MKYYGIKYLYFNVFQGKYSGSTDNDISSLMSTFYKNDKCENIIPQKVKNSTI